MAASRNISMDLLRVIACYMVIQVHAGEFFYIGEGVTVVTGDNSVWVNIYNSLARTAVPLFIMLTGYFLLPVKQNMSTFFKKRFTRVLIPFIIWCIVYAFYQYFTGAVVLKEAFINVLKIPVNFGTEVGHLWYIYMLIGLYLFAPIISPWIASASKKGIEFYLSLWVISLFIPYIHTIFPAIWAECTWNNTPMLYYFSGFLGYMILGYYAKIYWSERKSWNIPVGLLLIGVGYFITYYGFAQRLNTVVYAWDLELSWGYDTVNIAMMSAGLFLLIKNINIQSKTLTKIVTEISLKSYGIYLVHIIVLNFVHPIIYNLLPSAKLSVIPTSIITLILSYGIIKIISYIPGNKYIIG